MTTLHSITFKVEESNGVLFFQFDPYSETHDKFSIIHDLTLLYYGITFGMCP